MEEVNSAVVDTKTWHERLGYINLRAMKDLISIDLAHGVQVKHAEEYFCEDCQFDKSHKLPFKKEVEKNTEPGEMVHSDVCSPMKETSLGGARFFVTFKDDATGYRHAYFLMHKSDVLDRFDIYKREIRNKFGRPIRILRSDNGLEYVNKSMRTHLQSLGIIHERTAPYTPEQNGRAERVNRTIVECARTLLHAKNFPGYLCEEAVNAAVYLLSRVSTSTKDRGKTPYEI